MAINKFPTYCSDCNEKMPAGHGPVMKVAGRWVVSHTKFRNDQGSDDGYDALKDGIRERWG
jgi:hypothetical protein